MRAHVDHGRRAGVGGRGARASRAARFAAVVAGGLILCAPLTAAQSAKVQPVAVREAAGDAASGAPDPVRLQLGLASDGRLRAVISLAKALDPKDLLSDSGPPGSICLRLWTQTTPGTVPPDFLVCVTADKNAKLRATISQERVNAQPLRVGDAVLSRASSKQLVLKFARSRVGSPKKTIRFAVEATKRGCTRVSCVDTLPNAPTTATLKLF
jgi:hypothetical protein